MIQSRKRLAAAFAVSSILLQPTAAQAAADPRLHVLAVRSTSDHQVSLVVELRPRLPRELEKDAVSVTSARTRLPIQLSRVLSDQASVGFVMDASAEGAASLEVGARAGAASFLLQLPPAASTAVIADRQPPAVAAPKSVGVTDDLQATSAMKGSGPRATSAALTLALRQFGPGSAPVIVLYTHAPNAGGESAAELGDRLRQANTVLAVVNTSSDSRYWRNVAASTGGFAITAAPDQAITAFDSVADRLRSRYAVTFPRPAAGVRSAKLRVDTGSKVVAAVVTVPAAAPVATVPLKRVAIDPLKRTATDTGGAQPPGWLLGAGLLAVVLVVGVALRDRRPHPRTGRSATASKESADQVRQPALPGVRVFDVADPAGPREITNLLFEPRSERDARSEQVDETPQTPGKGNRRQAR